MMKETATILANIATAYHQARLHPDRFLIIDTVLRNLSKEQYVQFVRLINKKDRQREAYAKDFSVDWKHGKYGREVLSDADIEKRWSLPSLFCAYLIAQRQRQVV